MTPIEYVQLRAFARQDGALLSLLWIGSFACYIQGLTYPSLGTGCAISAIMRARDSSPLSGAMPTR